MRSGIFCLFENWNQDHQESLKEQIEFIQYAEKLGFDEAWLTEHHFNNFSLCPSPIALLSYALASTSKISIGSAAILLAHYHPIKMAESIATLELLSQGRFLFGIAKGAFPIFDISMGANPDKNRTLMLEANRIIQKLLYEEEVYFQGEFFEINNVSIRPKPQRLIPTYIASESIESIIEAAKEGYGILAGMGASLEKLHFIEENFRTNALEETPFTLALTRAFFVAESHEEAMEEAQMAIDIFIQCMNAAKENNPTFAQIIQDTAYERLRSELFDQNAILDQAIIGTPRECIEKIRTLKENLPLSSLILKPATASYKKAKEALRIYKEEIEPLL